MNYFFGNDIRFTEEVNWFFNSNHIFLALLVVTFIVALAFLLSAKSNIGKRITKLVLAGVLIILEVGRVIYKYMIHVGNGGTASTFNWWWSISFQMCAIMCWTTIFTLILSAFLKKENVFLQYLYNILLGCALVGGVLTFVYPDFLDAGLPLLNFANFQSFVVHALLVFVPIYLIKTKNFQPKFKEIWKPLTGFVFIGSVSMAASQISGQNFAYALSTGLLEDLGINLPFPWHLPVTLAIIFVIPFLIYSCFGIYNMIKARRDRKNNVAVEEKKEKITGKLNKAIYATSIALGIFVGMLLTLLIPMAFNPQPVNSWLGLVCIFGFAYELAMITFAEIYRLKTAQHFTEISKSWHITLTTILFIICLPVGILYLNKYLRNKKSN